MDTGLAYSEKYLEHNLGPRHPEKPERLESIINAIKRREDLSDETRFIEPAAAEPIDVELAHVPSYIEKVKRLSESEEMIDLDTPMTSETYDLALLAAGGAMGLSEKIAKGEFDNGFALVRPPGHHATRNQGGGFCYFNNIAISARKVIKENDFDKVMILDFDAHHGNGTQDIFYHGKDVLYMSFHQDGKSLYPGSGFPEEIGEREGRGYTVNVPFPPGSSDENYVEALKSLFVPISRQFDPDMIMVSAGLDSHADDPLTQLNLSLDGFRWLAETAIGQASKLCEGKIAFTLEGGYNVEASAKAVVEIVESLVEARDPDLPDGEQIPVFDEIKEKLERYWEL